MAACLMDTLGAIKIVVPVNGCFFNLQELQSIVGGYIQILELKDDKLMIVNEEGKVNGLDFNFRATSLALHSGAISSNDYIVGDVIICKSQMIK